MAAAIEPTAVVFRALSFAEASKTAEAENKIVFIDFYTTWCGPCKRLDETTWKDSSVAKLLAEKSIPLKVDAEQQSALAKKYGIEAYPTLLLLKPDGAELDRIVGYREPAKFVEEFNLGLTGKNALARAGERVASTQREEDQSKMLQARYDLGRELAGKGRCEEALKEFLWLYDDGMAHAPAFGGVRNSFLLGSISSLGQKYPPAIDALLQRRERVGQRIAASASDTDAILDFGSLNRSLHDDQRTMALFESLPSADPRRQTLAHYVFDQLVGARHYAEAASAFPAERMTEEFERMAKNVPDPEFAKYLVRSTMKHVEVLVGSSQIEAAQLLGKKVLELQNTTETKGLLNAAAVRAGHPELWASAPETLTN